MLHHEHPLAVYVIFDKFLDVASDILTQALYQSLE